MAKRFSPLLRITPKKIRRNPDNPRLIFREEDMNDLMDFVREYKFWLAVAVPVVLGIIVMKILS